MQSDLHRPACPCGWTGAACRPQDVKPRLASHQRGKKCGLPKPAPEPVAAPTDTTGAYPNDAACLDHDPELWFSHDTTLTDKRRTQEAVTICRSCPVAQTCLAEAMRAEQGAPLSKRHGVYGGLLPDQRMDLAEAMNA